MNTYLPYKAYYSIPQSQLDNHPDYNQNISY